MALSPLDAVFPGLGQIGSIASGVKSDPRIALLTAFLQNQAANNAAHQNQIKSQLQTDTKNTGLEAQQSALAQLQEIAKTGQTAASNAQRQEFLNQENTRLGGNREAILNAEQMRSGGNNTGNRLLAQLSDAQGSAGRGNMNALESANLVQQNQMNALGGIGGFTGQLQNRGSAIDAINQFNAANNINAAIAGSQGLSQIGQNNQFNAGQGMQGRGQLIGLLGSIAQGGGAAIGSDRKFKKDIKNADMDIEKFLDRLKSKNYKYKGSNEERTGIMAQDLDKSEVGKRLVINEPDGKYVDLQESVPVLLSSVANLHKRIKELQHG